MSSSITPVPGGDLTPQEPPRKPAGCLPIALGCGGVLLIILLFTAGLMWAIFAGMRRTGAYRMALRDAEASPCVVQKLGTPLQPGWFISGNTGFSNSDGSADLSFPVSGPKGSGWLHVIGNKLDGDWTVELLSLRVGDTRIKVLPVPSPCD